eukprot:g1670.t1
MFSMLNNRPLKKLKTFQAEKFEPVNNVVDGVICKSCGPVEKNVFLVWLKNALESSALRDNEKSYYLNLQKLFLEFLDSLSISGISYTLEGTPIELYDVKCSARFEDKTVKRIMAQWSMSHPNSVCPLRRGICVGRIGQNYTMCIGNAKFYDGSIESIFKAGYFEKGSKSDVVVISEKANGECTLCTASHFDTKHSNRLWLVLGSKNVRVALPYNCENTPSVAAEEACAYFNAIVDAADNIGTNARRFRAVGSMVKLWTMGLANCGLRGNLKCGIDGMNVDHDSNVCITSTLLLNNTVVGEQVGIHGHITTISKAHIRLFGVLEKKDLMNSIGGDVRNISHLLVNERMKSNFDVVKVESFDLREENKSSGLGQMLKNIRGGKMTVHGEGAVVYCYTKLKNSNKLRLSYVCKFKNEEYSFDRLLRTNLEAVAEEMHTTYISLSQLKSMCRRIQVNLKKTAKLDMVHFDRERLKQRLELIPYLIAYLSLTTFRNDEEESSKFDRWIFSSKFTKILSECEDALKSKSKKGSGENENEMILESRISIESICKRVDEIINAADESKERVSLLLQKHSEIISHLKNSIVRTPGQIANEIVELALQSGAKLIGVAAPPGGGKTCVLTHAVKIMKDHDGKPAKMFDRDAYVLENSRRSQQAVSDMWISDVAKHLASGGIAFVGNCFDWMFMEQFTRLLTKADDTCRDIPSLLVHWKEMPLALSKRKKILTVEEPNCIQSLFMLLCLDRLMRREGLKNDGSTLTVESGVLNMCRKFFTSAPSKEMIERRNEIMLRQNKVELSAVSRCGNGNSAQIQSAHASISVFNSSESIEECKMSNILSDILSLKKFVITSKNSPTAVLNQRNLPLRNLGGDRSNG